MSVFPDAVTRHREGFPWWVAQPTLAYLLAAAVLLLTEPRYAALRARLQPFGSRLTAGIRDLFDATLTPDEQAAAGRRVGSRALAALLGIAAAGFTAWHYLTTMIARSFGNPPFQPPE